MKTFFVFFASIVVLCIVGECKPVRMLFDVTKTESTKEEFESLRSRGKRSGIVDQRLNDMSLIFRFNKELQRKLANLKKMYKSNQNVPLYKWSATARKYKRSIDDNTKNFADEDAELQQIVDFLLQEINKRQTKLRHRKLNGFMARKSFNRYDNASQLRNQLYMDSLNEIQKVIPEQGRAVTNEEKIQIKEWPEFYDFGKL